MAKRVCIIYTGGTIGMVPSDKGYIPARHRFEDDLAAIADLHKPGMPELEVIQFDPLLDSSNMAIPEWNAIGRTVAENHHRFDGFVVLHGTDTMSYSASALSFMLENLDKSVVFTGAQIPLCELRSDGGSNIVSAVLIAAEGAVREVCIYFDGQLLRGCRSTKLSSDRFAAFTSPNFPPLGRVGIKIEYAHPDGAPKVRGAFAFHPMEQVNVGILKLFPGIQLGLFEPIMTERLRGVVLETFGAGNVPSSSSGELIPIIRKAYGNGSLIVVCSQCMQGTVTLGAYETSKALSDIGAVSGRDMTTEAAMTKLIYLFSLGLPVEKVRTLMEQNLRGELS
ncbi:MAG: type I asparaginase [Clostridiales bacterium]|nr:type I asparaginase [Candidatus Apopatocola equi]